MYFMETLCKECVFKTNDENNKQSGCVLNNLDEFHDKGLLTPIEDGDVTYFKIGGICKDVRSQNWLEKVGYTNVTNDNLDSLKSILFNENKKSFDVFFNFDSGNKSDMLSKLSGLITSKYQHNMVNIIFTDNNVSKVDIVNSLRYSNIGKWNVIRTFESFESECIKQIENKKSQWIYILKDDAVAPNFEYDFNFVNNDSDYNMVFENDNCIVLLKHIYVALVNVCKQKLSDENTTLNFKGKPTNINIFDGSIESLVEYAKDAGIYKEIT